MSLIIEARLDGWELIGRVRPGDPPASMTNHAEGRRDVILFDSSARQSTICKSIAGVDTEFSKHRLITTNGLEILAHLRGEQTYEQDIQTDRMPAPIRFRFSHVDDPEADK